MGGLVVIACVKEERNENRTETNPDEIPKRAENLNGEAILW
jgi:hypothetical protein